MNNHSGFSSPLQGELLYRNQFVLGPRFVDRLKNWKRIRLGRSIYLTVHPDLSVIRETGGDRSITLLGYMLDPYNEASQDEDIVRRLIRKFSGLDDLFEHTFSLGGRWILIAQDGDATRIFHDAAGSRQVFYTHRDLTQDVWCASGSALLAETLKLPQDKEAVDFIRYFYHVDKEYWWPGDCSAFRGIRHLLPNHYLDLETGVPTRYWPNRENGRLELDEVVERASRGLKGMMRSAARRFDLALSLTAGWDSRLVLAASRSVCDKVSYMTVKTPEMPENHADLQIPAHLLRKLGLEHDLMRSPETADTYYEKTYKTNVAFAHDVWVSEAQAIKDYYSQSKVAVTGSASEIVRDPVMRDKGDERFTADELVRSMGLGENRFAVDHFEQWLSQVGQTYDISLDNLFYWEQRVGNWLAMNHLEFDSAWKDILTPFNCRTLLMDLLSADKELREGPRYELYERLIMNLWPEVLEVPINPHKKKTFVMKIKSFLRSKLRA